MGSPFGAANDMDGIPSIIATAHTVNTETIKPKALKLFFIIAPPPLKNTSLKIPVPTERTFLYRC
jgi:hypothetical protein